MMWRRFESLAAAQEAIDGWVHVYNHARLHRSLDERRLTEAYPLTEPPSPG
jgi:transposase InsO family protein